MTAYKDMTPPERARHMEALIREYFDGCNEADIDKMVKCFEPEGTHYFPPGMYEGPFRGARKIADKWAEAVAKLGSYWTVDRVVCDPEKHEAVIEWSHFKTKQNKILRGDEWYVFHPETGRILEIRAYYASPQAPDLDVLELGGFDYEGLGYPSAPPAGAR